MKKNNRSVSDNFGSLIKHLREQKGYTLKKMEEMTGVSATYICRIEAGERKAPSIPIVRLLADALDVKLAEMLDASNNKFDEANDIATLLLASNFFVKNSSLLQEKVKKLLVEIIDKTVQVSLKPETRFEDALEIFELINKLRNELPKSGNCII